MRLLGLDYGTKRVGVAVSDEMKMIAQPLEYIPAHPFGKLVLRLRTIITEKEVDQIVVGMPRNMNGSYGDAAQAVRSFVVALKEALVIPITTWDERLTSSQANRFLAEGKVKPSKRREKVDKTAAAIILQAYLDSLFGK